MQKNNNTLSIIIPLFNKENHILATINSILSQESDDFEVIVVDDGSTDNSVKIIQNIVDTRIHLFQKENGGVSSARNYGVKKAHGDWVLFLDADDTLENNVISNMLAVTARHKKCQFFCFNHFFEDNDGKHLYSNKYKKGYVLFPFIDWCRGVLMPRAGAALFRKNLLIKHPFNEKIRRYEDAEHLFSIMRNTGVYRSPIPIMTYNHNSAEASKPCSDIKNDFIGHLSPKGKNFGEQLALYQLYLQGCNLYPNDMKLLYGTSFKKKKYEIANRIITHDYNLIKKNVRKIKRILKGILNN